ncbi:MAG: hypothetical protein LBG65_03950 [Puniceicoccales bacterium]|jgi:hypothetical protein|nr:hypothetical protein [Puniceicoccales bacterium]
MIHPKAVRVSRVFLLLLAPLLPGGALCADVAGVASAAGQTSAPAPAAKPPKLENIAQRFDNGAGWEIKLDVLSWDKGSALFVRNLARHTEQMLAKVFPEAFIPPPPEQLHGRVVAVNIELPKREEIRWPGPFKALSMPGNDVLAIKWSRETRVEDLRFALARAALARLALACQAPAPAPVPAGSVPPPPEPGMTFEAAFDAIPAWLTNAFLLEMELRDNAGPDHRLVAGSHRAPLPTLAEIGSARVSPAAAFWFLRHVRAELHRAGIPEYAFFSGILLGGGPDKVLGRHFPKIAADTDQRALWWPLGYVRLTRSNAFLRGAQTMRESAGRFRQATSFLLAPAGVDRSFRADALAGMRSLPAAGREAAIRLRRLRHELPGVNPVWHNAFQSYGIFLERLPDASDAELARLWRQVEADASHARFLQEAVEKALREK